MAVQPVATETASQSAHLLSLEELRAALQATGEERYHHKHPFHLLMHEGKLSRGQLQAWALNRYYYQSIIPIKIRSSCRAVRTRFSDAPGASAWSTTMATPPAKAASNAG
jgi:coenzyme PQQ biosynthesis protein C